MREGWEEIELCRGRLLFSFFSFSSSNSDFYLFISFPSALLPKVFGSSKQFSSESSNSNAEPRRDSNPGNESSSISSSSSETSTESFLSANTDQGPKDDRDEYPENSGEDKEPRRPSIFSLGIGSPVNSKNAQIQLAFLSLLSNYLSSRSRLSSSASSEPTNTAEVPLPASSSQGSFNPPTSVQIYDPVFSKQDIYLLEIGLGYECLIENKVGNHPFSSPSHRESNTTLNLSRRFKFQTLIYMPHCPRTLYENFLRSNWTPETLSGLLFCWNDLRTYSER